MKGSHHPIFSILERSPSSNSKDFDINFVGSKVRTQFEAPIPGRGIFGSGRCAKLNTEDLSLPSPNGEDYLEWIDILEAIQSAGEKFVMIEAGAGYGRWLVNAARAVRRLKNSKIKEMKLVGVELDKTRFDYMLQHFRDNDLYPEEHLLIQAGVSAKPGYAFQEILRSKVWEYGERLVHSEELDRLAQEVKTADLVSDGQVVAKGVRCVTLSSLVEKFDCVDLIDFDLQGEELLVIQESVRLLNERVKRVHIGTHSEEIEAGLRKVFKEYDWHCLNDYSLGRETKTPYGDVSFTDGTQTWVNSRF